MNFKIFDTLRNEKRLFTPINADEVKIYSCGPTVYKAPHLGNFRSFVVFDVLYRFLSYLYPKVTYVRNITDVDDKIINEAKLRDIGYNELTAEVIDEFKLYSKQLNIIDPTYEPKATDYINNMISDIQKLIDDGFAYVANDHVLFDTTKYEDYRDFCTTMTSDAGARVAVSDFKKNENDFVLWKPATGVCWESPWGNGRPGWHIECTSMSKDVLGLPFDIHCGGQDLIFPHHTNERAQGWGLCKHECANYWMHNNFLNIGEDKMSKSLGNVMELRDLLTKYHPMVIRIFLMSAHYRHPLVWSESALQQAENIYKKWSMSLSCVANHEQSHKNIAQAGLLPEVLDALADDLNLPLAVTRISQSINESQDLLKDCMKNNGDIAQHVQQILESCKVIGITFDNDHDVDESYIAGMIANREEARKNKDYKLSDEIRDKLLEQGIILQDTSDGIKWHRDISKKN